MKRLAFKTISVFIVLFSLLNLCGCKKLGMPCVCGNEEFVRATYSYSDLKYKTLEEYLIEAEEIVYATYTGESEEFSIHKPKESCLYRDTEEYLIFEYPKIKGDSVFKVRVINCPIGIENDKHEAIEELTSNQFRNKWERGKTYILLLEKYETGEDDGIERFSMISDAVIPVDGGEATLYSEPIEKHSIGYTGEGDIDEYIREFLKNGDTLSEDSFTK